MHSGDLLRSPLCITITLFYFSSRPLYLSIWRLSASIERSTASSKLLPRLSATRSSPGIWRLIVATLFPSSWSLSSFNMTSAPIARSTKLCSGRSILLFCLLRSVFLARVSFGIDLLQLGDAVVRIDLRRLQGRMSEQFLYRPHVGAVVEQFGGEGVPEYVRTLFALNAALSQLALYGPIDGAAGDSFSLLI